MNGFNRLIHEMHRRSLWQVLGIYSLGSWFAYEVILGLREGVGLPDWVAPMAIALFVMGLPIVLATAFVQEGGPGGGGEAPAQAAGPGTRQGDSDEPPATPAPPRPPTGMARHLTWRRALGGGVLAFSLLALTTGAFLGMRSLGVGPVGTLVAKGVLDERDPILLADFDNTTPDASLGRVITDALRIDLLESSTVRVVDPADVREVLQRMGRGGEDPLVGEEAREAALRGGWKATIEGDVAPVGGGYLLTARVVAAADGQVLAGFREQARGGDELLSAIDRLSKAIRTKVGESLRSVQGGMPLEAVSTSSLDALRLYSQATRLDTTDPQRAIELYEAAVARDTTFAMAYRKLGAVLSNTGLGHRREVEVVSRAYALRDRLNERERAHTTAFYHLNITGDYAAAVAAYRNVLDRWPDDYIALNNLALAHIRARQDEEATAVLEGIDGALSATNIINLMDARFALGDTAGARELLEQARETRLGDLPADGPYRAALLSAMGEIEEAGVLLDSLRTVHHDMLGRTWLDGAAAALALTRGHIVRARRLQAEAEDRFRRAGLTPQRLGVELAATVALLDVTRDRAAALRAVDEMLAAEPLEGLDAYERPYLQAAQVLAKAGAPDRAARLLDEYEAAVPAEHRGEARPRLLGARGLVALEQGRNAEAVRLLEEATRTSPCAICLLPELGRAYAASERLDDAIDAHERFLDTPVLFRFPAPGYQLPRVLEDLGLLYEARGDRARAAATYARLLDLWADADAPLAARREAARARLQALTSEI